MIPGNACRTRIRTSSCDDPWSLESLVRPEEGLHEGDDYSCILAMDLRRANRW